MSPVNMSNKYCRILLILSFAELLPRTQNITMEWAAAEARVSKQDGVKRPLMKLTSITQPYAHNSWQKKSIVESGDYSENQ